MDEPKSKSNILKGIGSIMKGGIKGGNVSSEKKESRNLFKQVIQKVEPFLSKKVETQDDTKELQQAVDSVKINEDTTEETKEDKETSKSLDTGFKFLSGELKITNDKLDTLISINESSLKVSQGFNKTLNDIKSILLAQVAQDKEQAENAEEAAREGALEQTKDSSGTQQYEKTYDDTPSLGKMLGGVMGAIDFADDVFDFSRKLGGKRRRGLKGNRAYKKFRRSRPGRFFGRRFNLPRGIRSRRKLSAGGFLNTSYPAMSGGGMFPGTPSPQPVMIGEAGTEVVTAPKLAAGGLKPGVYDNPTRGNLMPGQAVIPLNRNVGKSAAGVDGIKKGEGMGFSQPLATAMTLPFKAFGAGIFGIAASFLSVLGPLAGLIKPVIAALARPLAKVLGVPGNLLTGILGGSASAATLDTGNVFDDLRKQYGDKGQGTDKDGKDKSTNDKNNGGDGSDPDVGPIKDGPMFEKGARIAKKLQQLLGIKDYQAAGIVGNLIQESSLVPDRIQGSGMRKGPLKIDGVTGYSYPQWTSADRQRNFAEYMESKGHDWKKKGATDELATGFVAKEFKGYMSSVFKATKNVAAASKWVLHNYEKPADQGRTEQNERASDSNSVLSKMTAESGTSTTNEDTTKSYIIKGPNSGYPIKITTNDGVTTDLIAHGEESVSVGDTGFTVLPFENNKWSISKNPLETLNQWNKITSSSPKDSSKPSKKMAEGGGWFNWFGGGKPKKKERELGARAKLKGKDVYWAGKNYGWQRLNGGGRSATMDSLNTPSVQRRFIQDPVKPASRFTQRSTNQKTQPTKPQAVEDKSLTPMQQWAKNFPDLAKKVKPGQSGYQEIQAYYQKQALSAASKKGFELAAKGIDLSKVTTGATVPPATAQTVATAQASVIVANAAASKPTPLPIPTPPPAVPTSVPRKETIQSVRQRELLCRL